MLNHMTMPVLFAVLIGVLVLVSVAAFFVFRVLGARAQTNATKPTTKH